MPNYHINFYNLPSESVGNFGQLFYNTNQYQPGAWTARRVDCPAHGLPGARTEKFSDRRHLQNLADVICEIWATSFVCTAPPT